MTPRQELEVVLDADHADAIIARRQVRNPLRGLEYIESRSIPEPNSGCWLWLGAVDKKGYGVISKEIFGEFFAHRYSLKSSGVIIADLCACHRCDNPICVNPDHLFSGTRNDNIRDAMAKGRHKGGNFSRFGEDINTAKLTWADVSWIRENYVAFDKVLGCGAMAKKFGVDRNTITNARLGRNWK